MWQARGVSILTVFGLGLVLGGVGLVACGGDDDELSDGGPLPRNDYCDPVQAWDEMWSEDEMEVLRLVNQRRSQGATCGGDDQPPAPPLQMNAALRCAARVHSMDMGERDYFAHDTPEGVSPWDRMSMAEYDASGTGENIAGGYPTPEAVVEGWMNSPGHCRNIMAAGSNELGVGYFGDGRLWTQKFGRRNEG